MLFWTVAVFALLGLVAVIAGVVFAAREGASKDAAGVFITGIIVLVICEVVAAVLAVIGWIVG